MGLIKVAACPLPLDGGGLGWGWTLHLGRGPVSISAHFIDSTPPQTPPPQGEGLL
jgi:hypothetical protein